MKRVYKLFLFLFMCVFVSLPVYGIGTTGKISGRITDKTTGEPLPFVNVIVMGSSMGAATDLEGYYTINNIPPGSYTVKASAIGYNPVTYKEVKVNIDLTTKVDFQLADVSIELGEDIIVTAEKPLIRQDQTATTAVVGSDLIKELPVTEIGDVLSLQAGIVVSPGGALHVRGGRAGQISYQIDGVPVTDAYDGGTVVDVNTEAVQELQVISGAFNAEYGQALSGVVNLVTKDGKNTFNGSVAAYFGDYASDRTDLFWDINNINPIAIRNMEASFSGPIIKDKLFFFTNGRYYYNEGYFFGKRTYNITDYAVTAKQTGGNEWFVLSTGDKEYVPMNPHQRIFAQGKLSYRVMPGMNLSYNYIFEDRQFKYYDHGNRLTPDNNLERFQSSNTNILALNHAISASSFYTLSASYYFKDYEHYLFKDLYTEDGSTLYINPSNRSTPPYSFTVGGTNNNRFKRNSSTYVAKLDWTTQVNPELEVKFGAEYRQHKLFYHNINLVPMTDENGQQVVPYNVMIPSASSQNNDQYTKEPLETSGYVQTKFEAFNLIFNAGVRFDVFDPDGVVLNDPSDPTITSPIKPENQFFDANGNGIQDPGEAGKTVEDRLKYWYKDATVKTQLSPRLGLAFPYSPTGVLHFSYGHFFQLPRYELLYSNPDFEFDDGTGNVGILGNADLNPQKTVKGEIGIQQALTDNIAIDVTVFFEDFRNLTGTQADEIEMYGKTKTYSRYANSDFGFSKGVIFKFSQRFSQGLAINLDYTYSITKGNASNPSDARNALAGGAAPETFIAPLDWNQPHTINLSVAYSVPNNYGFSIIGNYYSGQPYTPAVNKNTRVASNAFPRNSAVKPSIVNVDLRAYKDFQVFGNKLSFFMKVYNLLDAENPTGVYSDTGDPRFTFDKWEAENNLDPILYNNTLDDLYNNPGYFSEPRRVEFGVSYYF